MPSRLDEYESLLQKALYRGYEIHSVFSFWSKINTSGLDPHKKYLILRHDIDTDLSTAKEMWKIEQRLGIAASYYFRLSTIDISFMQLIHKTGSEASYHYEELASYCKRNGIKKHDKVHKEMDHIRSIFKENYLFLKKQTMLPMKTVASHGDFVNRKLRMANEEILKDKSLRKELGIVFEVYDDTLMTYLTKRYSDTLAPSFWKPENPIESFQRNEHIVYILTHPRHWRRHILENTLDNIKRFWEGIRYHLRW